MVVFLLFDEVLVVGVGVEEEVNNEMSFRIEDRLFV